MRGGGSGEEESVSKGRDGMMYSYVLTSCTCTGEILGLYDKLGTQAAPCPHQRGVYADMPDRVCRSSREDPTSDIEAGFESYVRTGATPTALDALTPSRPWSIPVFANLVPALARGGVSDTREEMKGSTEYVSQRATILA